MDRIHFNMRRFMLALALAAIASLAAASPALADDLAPAATPGLGAAADSADSADAAGPAGAPVNMYRLYNPWSGEHFYTGDLAEAKDVAAAGWQWEGVGWVAPAGGEPVYRLYNANAGDHHYTLSANERDGLVALGWSYEGVGWRSERAAAGRPVYRQYNPNQPANNHNFTADAGEDAALGELGWAREGVAWYSAGEAAAEIEPFWLVTPAWGELERYWVCPDASIASGRLIAPDEGTGCWAYARPGGAVVRGKWDDGAGHVYVADNDGALAQTGSGASGWLVTADYDGGLQRYYYDRSLHAMRTGFLDVGGKRYFGQGGVGYVARNQLFSVGEAWYYADNDGVLEELSNDHDLTLARAKQEVASCTDPSMSKEDKLWAAFCHVRDDFEERNPRIPHNHDPGWEIVYANDIFVGRYGNCISYAAAFAFMAKAIGYDNVYACQSDGHGWAEVDNLVYDPECAKNRSGYTYFGVSYSGGSDVNYAAGIAAGYDWMHVAV